MGIMVKKHTETRRFMEGAEECREYYKTEKITFGSSYLLPGQRGETDRGHRNSEEVFYVAKGVVLLEGDDSCYEMYGVDAALVLPGTPHTLTNIGEEPALVTWSLAPGESSDLGSGDRSGNEICFGS